MTLISYITLHPVSYYTIIILVPFNFSVPLPQAREIKSSSPVLVPQIQQSVKSASFYTKTHNNPRARVCVCVFVSRNTSSGALRCKSAQEAKCVLPGASRHLEWLFSLSGRSWEELNSLSHINLKTRMRQDVTSSWTLAIHYFSLSVCFLLPLCFDQKKKKRTLPAANQLLQSWWIPHNCNQSW